MRTSGVVFLAKQPKVRAATSRASDRYPVVDDGLSPTFPLGDAIETFVRPDTTAPPHPALTTSRAARRLQSTRGLQDLAGFPRPVQQLFSKQPGSIQFSNLFHQIALHGV